MTPNCNTRSSQCSQIATVKFCIFPKTLIVAKEIVLTQDLKAIVDDSDYDRLNSRLWYAVKKNNTSYAIMKYRNEKGQRLSLGMHRFLLEVTDSKIVVDHIDRNGLNNQRSNLRICTVAENMLNSTSFGLSKYKGVSWHKKTKLWRARITIKGKDFSLGYFKTELEAAFAYDIAAKTMFPKYGSLNFT